MLEHDVRLLGKYLILDEARTNKEIKPNWMRLLDCDYYHEECIL